MSASSSEVSKPFMVWKHLNKLRWVCLITVLLMLIFIPLLSIYQHYVAAQVSYRNISENELFFYNTMEYITAPFVNKPVDDLDALKGTTWSGQLFGLKLSDPLAIVGQMSSGLEVYWPFVLTGFIPIMATLLLGRFFCGWICPATLIYELNTNLSVLLRKMGMPTGNRRLDRRFKYAVLLVGIILSAYTGTILFASVYPPAVIGRELYFSIALSGFGGGSLFFITTLLFDLFVAKRGFCRYICPGGALYSLLGRFRPIRIKRIVESCNDCAKCNAVCEFVLDPMRDDFGQECNNCCACIAVCPEDAMTFTLAFQDVAYQGHGHTGRHYRALEKTHGVGEANE